MDRDYDVVIAGAGPAGASAALYARRAGLSVLLLDRRKFPRDKICGDAVARKSLGYLRDLGLWERLESVPHERIGAAVLGAPGGAALDINLAGETARPHAVCRREIFDNILVEAARRELDVHDGCAVRDLLRDGARVRGVRFRDGTGAIRTVTAGCVVGADGYNSVVARALGLYRHDSTRWYVATRAYYRGLDCPAHTVEVHFLPDTLPGFLWMFPAGDGLTNVGLGMLHRDVKRAGRSIRDVHESALQLPRFRDRFARAEAVGGIHGSHLPTPDFSRVIHGDGFLLAGDAAGLVDPFSGEGIGNAMCSGKVAAGVLADAAAAGRDGFGASSLGRYPERLWKELDASEIRLHYRLRTLARRRALVDFVIGRAGRHRDTLDWLTGMTDEHRGTARKRQLLSPLSWLRMLFRQGRPAG
jgi:geranylgeranyl reductase family protein